MKDDNSITFSVLDLFSIGIGPSSSHTVGPMRAAAEFAKSLEGVEVGTVHCSLFGSLADTGKGHGTGTAIVLGFEGYDPATVPVDEVDGILDRIRTRGLLRLPDGREIPFVERDQVSFMRRRQLSRHPNTMHFSATNLRDEVVRDEVVYSIGGGFVVNENDWENEMAQVFEPVRCDHPFYSAEELLAICKNTGLSVSELIFLNESAFRSESETRERIDDVWEAMESCIERGLSSEGILPGGLKVRRRAKDYHASLLASANDPGEDTLTVLDWVNVFALAVNEENAAGGRVVTAPTNGAAGVLPAVLKYAVQFRKSPYQDGIHRFFLAAGAIGSLYKMNASISGADVGCQGEVGVACSMAAGALAEYLGGTPEQVEFAAEIGMEHNLGLTCDPIGGLVQIPCIERNAMGAVKAINAARLAMKSEGVHHVSLDKVIRTMKATGRDMKSKYKETARGGLAVNVVEC